MTIKILLPVDGSDCALRALEHLLVHAGWLREAPEVHLLHVHAPIPIGRVQSHIGAETLKAYYQEESQSELNVAEARLRAADCVFTTHIHVGQPAEVIAKVASELACHLIFMGSHGRGAVAGLLMGSVATRVLHLVQSPVLLVK